jgi:hypothetical protein
MSLRRECKTSRISELASRWRWIARFALVASPTEVKRSCWELGGHRMSAGHSVDESGQRDHYSSLEFKTLSAAYRSLCVSVWMLHLFTLSWQLQISQFISRFPFFPVETVSWTIITWIMESIRSKLLNVASHRLLLSLWGGHVFWSHLQQHSSPSLSRCRDQIWRGARYRTRPLHSE